jgi:hypothetical protein
MKSTGGLWTILNRWTRLLNTVGLWSVSRCRLCLSTGSGMKSAYHDEGMTDADWTTEECVNCEGLEDRLMN